MPQKIETEYEREQRAFRELVENEKRDRRKSWVAKLIYRFGKKPTKS